ncbi:hypothetical protein [Tessaracoccus lapidicaptus]|uniref:hypothetical protein n=1 Tax=Tessaracoccus lapidicaptus TaxID=1427523 RepID=UPI00334218E1
MGLSDLTDPGAVMAAMREYDAIGRDAFLDKYGFKPARRYFLVHDGRRYDSKAIVGAAYGFQHGSPLLWDSFSGGEATVAPLLQALGFDVIRNPHAAQGHAGT